MDRRDLLKIGELARRANVPLATLRHYAREGLITPKERGRNIAYYEPSVVDRILAIKELQQNSFLPLSRIKAVLEGHEAPPLQAVAKPLERALRGASSRDRRTRAELLASGVSERELDWLRAAGVVECREVEGTETYAGDDLELLRVLGRARRAGLSAKMLPLEIVGDYLVAIQALTAVELRLFEEGVLPNAGSRLGELTEAAATLSERLVVLLRRKQLLPALAARLGAGSSQVSPHAPGRLTPRTKSRK